MLSNEELLIVLGQQTHSSNMYMLQLYHKIERFIDRVKVTSRGYYVMGPYTAGRPCDITKCGTARYVLELTCLRKKKHFHVKTYTKFRWGSGVVRGRDTYVYVTHSMLLA
jgi:hypothetical protein